MIEVLNKLTELFSEPIATDNPDKLKLNISTIEAYSYNILEMISNSSKAAKKAEAVALVKIKADPVQSKYTEKERMIILDDLVSDVVAEVEMLTEIHKSIRQRITLGQSFLRHDGIQTDAEQMSRKSGISM